MDKLLIINFLGTSERWLEEEVLVEEQEMQLATLVLTLDVVWVRVAVWAAAEVLEAKGVAKVEAKSRVEIVARDRGRLAGRDRPVGKVRLGDRGAQERHPDERTRWRTRTWRYSGAWASPRPAAR